MWRAATVAGTTIVARPTELLQEEGFQCSAHIVSCGSCELHMHCQSPICVFSAPCEDAKGEMRLQRPFPPFCRWWRRSSSECFSGEKIQKRGLRAPAASDNISFAASVATHFGALAQLGERMAGSHEVRGSIPLCSTKFFRPSGKSGGLFAFL